jgi:hypothetical protein
MLNRSVQCSSAELAMENLSTMGLPHHELLRGVLRRMESCLLILRIEALTNWITSRDNVHLHVPNWNLSPPKTVLGALQTVAVSRTNPRLRYLARSCATLAVCAA